MKSMLLALSRGASLLLRDARPVCRYQFLSLQQTIAHGAHEAFIVCEVCMFKDDDLEIPLCINLFEDGVEIFS